MHVKGNAKCVWNCHSTISIGISSRPENISRGKLLFVQNCVQVHEEGNSWSTLLCFIVQFIVHYNVLEAKSMGSQQTVP